MAITPLSTGLGSAQARHGAAGAPRFINCYAEEVGQLAKAPWNVHACDGFDDFATLTGGAGIRAMLAITDQEMLVVSGRVLFRIDQTGTSSVVGGIPSDGHVTMARNRRATPQTAIVCDGLYFKYESGFSELLTDEDLPPPVSVANLNGYFVFMLRDGRMFSSELDETNVLATDFAKAASKPDGGVIAWVRGQELMAGGSLSIEVWADQGGEAFPLGRVTNVKRAEDDRDIGVLSARSVVESYFVGSDGTVREIRGYQAAMISGPFLNDLIAREVSPSTIKGFLWSSRGHTFYCVSGTGWTYCYDTTTKLWHERQSYDATTWKVGTAELFDRSIILGDAEDNKLYRINIDTFTEAGQPLIMTVVTPPVHAFPYRLQHNALHVDMVPGVGLVTGDDNNVNPSVMLDFSDDGGATFGTQRTAALGAAGQRLKRVRFNRLGAAYSRHYRLSISDAVPRSMVQLALDSNKIGV